MAMRKHAAMKAIAAAAYSSPTCTTPGLFPPFHWRSRLYKELSEVLGDGLYQSFDP